MSESHTQSPRRPGLTWLATAAPKRLCRVFCLMVCCLALLGSSARAAVAGHTLVFGMSAAFSGPARSLGMEYQRGIMAAFTHVNDHGGAGGWRLALSLRDDGYGPAAALNNTIGFVEQERVFALLGYVGTPTTARVLPLLKYYEASDMALLFPLTGADMLRDRSYDDCVFNLRGSYIDETRTLVEALLATGRKHIAVFHQSDVYGRNGWDGVRRALAAHGLAMVAEATYGRGAHFSEDFQREVGILLLGNPDAIITVGTAPACAAFVRDLRGAGFANLVATLSFADADNMARFLRAQARVTGRDYLSGIVFSQVVPCYEDKSLPAVRLYQQSMARLRGPRPPQLAPDEYIPQRYSFVSFEGFLAGLALAKVVKHLGGDPTRERLRAIFEKIRPVDLGLREKVDLRPGIRQGLRRTYLTVYRNGHFIGVDNLKAVAR
ncbi:MAG: ABC transporter substrate-binding protein [Humidesulfovibrio sp.]|nr:ABC transporter substrate-binding protein [Humidesulfovibrio sp.]